MAGISLLAICKCPMILVFVFCLHILTAEGRQLKSLGRYHNDPAEVYSVSKDQAISGTYDLKSSPGVHHSVTGFTHDFRPTDPGNSPGVGHPLPTDVSTKKATVFGSTPEQHSVTGLPGDFRPTDPGHSPGIGHHFPEDDDEPKGPASNRPVSGFKPTTPGHSPGVGHVMSEKNARVTKNKDSVMKETEDFRPTTPGHSPGIGHVSRQKNAEAPTA